MDVIVGFSVIVEGGASTGDLGLGISIEFSSMEILKEVHELLHQLDD